MSTVQLYQGDCLEFLRTLKPGSVDAVVTDPPYGKVTHAGARTNQKLSIGVTPITFASMSCEDFVSACAEFVRVARRWVVTFCEWQYAAKVEEAGLPLIRLGVWTKTNPMPQLTGDRPGTGWEAVCILHRTGKKKWNGGGSPAVWNHGTTRYGYFGPSNHPTEKPVQLIRQMVEQFSDPGDTVFDPFMGSGTTGVACVQTGRNFIGCEIDPKYFAIAKRRIDEAQGVGTLFDPAKNPSLFSEETS